MSGRGRQRRAKSPPGAVGLSAERPDVVRVKSKLSDERQTRAVPCSVKTSKIERQPRKEEKPKDKELKQPTCVKVTFVIPAVPCSVKNCKIERKSSMKDKLKSKEPEQPKRVNEVKPVTPAVPCPVKNCKIERQPRKEEKPKDEELKQPKRLDEVKPVVRRALVVAGECVKRDTSGDMAVAKNVEMCDDVLFTTLKKLKIKQIERAECSRIINGIIKGIMDHMKKKTECFKEVKDLRTGSYYENLKISNPDEFDVMLTFPVSRVDIQKFGDDGAFYSVAFKRGKHLLDRFLQDDNTISAYKMLKEFRKEVTTCVNPLKDVEVEKKKTGCPAVTLLITGAGTAISLDVVLSLEVQTQWPSFTDEGFKIEEWLGRKVKQGYRRKEPYYLVPKYEGKGAVERNGICAKDAWRISFSHVEKSILMNHGSQKTCCEAGGSRCCRKDCLKLLKHLLSLLKEKDSSLSKFCSYHGKTALLHACCSRPLDSEWEAGHLGQCFTLLLQAFERSLEDGLLPNFFIPTQNLLAGIGRKSCLTLAQHISRERSNGFPIFHH